MKYTGVVTLLPKGVLALTHSQTSVRTVVTGANFKLIIMWSVMKTEQRAMTELGEKHYAVKKCAYLIYKDRRDTFN
jgi:hypothetical protein